jgi:hypothetical protein
MSRRWVSAAALVLLLAPVAVAETYQGGLVKFEDDRVTLALRAKEGFQMTFKFAKDATFIVKLAKSKDRKEEKEGKEVKLSELKRLLKDSKGRGVSVRLETTGKGDARRATKVTILLRGKPKTDKE